MKPVVRSLLYSSATGLLLGAAFPPVPVGFTAFIGFIPLLHLLDGETRLGRTFRRSYIAFLIMNLTTVYWISGWTGDDIWLKVAGVVVNLVHPLLFTLPMLVYVMVQRRLGRERALWAFPAIWVTYEYLAHLPELSFPWLLLANTQTYQTRMIDFISVTGPFGVSLWIVTINVLLFQIWWRFRTGSSWRSRGVLRIAGAVAAVYLVPALLMWGFEPTPREEGSIRVGIVQPDINPYEKWSRSDSPLSKLQSLTTLYDSLVIHDQPDVVLFPETAIPFRILMQDFGPEYEWFRRHIDSMGVPVLTGFPDLVWYVDAPAPTGAKRVQGTEHRYNDFNSAMLVPAGAGRPQIYHKSRLTPMSERVPYMEHLPFLEDALNWGVGISSWGLGNDTTVFSLSLARGGAVRLWPMICYETLYPSFVAGFVDRGAQVLAVITNDGWFGRTSGPHQLQRYTVLRAMENRRAVARCANNGISCFIDPLGHVRAETALYARGTICESIPVTSVTTVYTRLGDWPALLCVLITLGLLIAAPIHHHRNRKRKDDVND